MAVGPLTLNPRDGAWAQWTVGVSPGVTATEGGLAGPQWHTGMTAKCTAVPRQTKPSAFPAQHPSSPALGIPVPAAHCPRGGGRRGGCSGKRGSADSLESKQGATRKCLTMCTRCRGPSLSLGRRHADERATPKIFKIFHLFSIYFLN